MTYDFDDVRVIRSGDAPSVAAYREQRERTPQQKHTDEALANAAASAGDGLENVTEALRWLTSIGADVPARLKGIPTLLVQLGTFIDDEKGRRG